MSGIRLYDRIVAGLLHQPADAPDGWFSTIPEMVRVCPIFMLHDVARLCLPNGEDSTRRLDAHVIASPFPMFWAEFRPGDFDCGVLAQIVDDDPLRMRGIVFFGKQNDAALLAGSFKLQIGKDGHPISLDMAEHDYGQLFAAAAPNSLLSVTETSMSIFLYGLSILNAKNVTRRQEKLPRSIRRHPGSFATSVETSHYVLDIPGLSEFRQSVSGIGGKEARLHIVRGHFADYSEGGGLFGKLHGRYYIAPHVRGNAEKGVITKDYNVRASA